MAKTYCGVCETDLAENDGHQEDCFAADYGIELIDGGDGSTTEGTDSHG